MDPDRWEYANEGFQKGQKHLLKTIKRRNKNTEILHTKAEPQSSLDSTNPKPNAELQKLKNDRDTLMMEILKLKEQQERTQNQLAAAEDKLRITEFKQLQMVVFMARVFRSPHFIEKSRKKKELAGVCGDEVLKKQKLVAAEGGEGVGEVTAGKKQVQEELVTIELELQTLFSGDESGSPLEDRKGNEVEKCGTSSPNYNSQNFILWEKLMEDDMIFENETARELAKYQSKIVLDLEDLIAKPLDLGLEMKELVEQLGHLISLP